MPSDGREYVNWGRHVTMLLYAEKLLPVFVYPVGLSLVLCAVALALSVARRSVGSRVTVSAAIVLLWISSMPAFADLITATLEEQYPALPIDSAPIVDVIVVLGGDIASPRGRLSAPELGEGADRLFEAYALWHAGKAKLILISGGDLPWTEASRPEAEIVGQAFPTLGVPTSAILVEGESHNTRENAVNTAVLWREKGFHTGLLVTSAIHLPRAMETFRAAGLDLTPWPADFRMHYSQGYSLFDFLPDARALSLTTLSAKEWLGLAVYHWLGWA
jgi:uncharacterized SAM-binding protein YcdF (DUF218 family)